MMYLDSLFLKRVVEYVEDPEKQDLLAFRRFHTYVLACLSIVLICISIFLNFYSENYDVIPILISVGGIIIIASITLYIKHAFLLCSQYVILITLCILGVGLLTHQGSYNPAVSLVWFIIFPSMVMFTMGLYQGTLLFLSYFILLIILFLFPHDFGVNENITQGARIRLLLAMLGSFAYSWGAEYIRYKTQFTLTTLLLNTEKLAYTDSLTGLRNRRGFQSILENIISVSKSTRRPFAVIMMDLDHFKKINDTYGHDIGDMVLKHFADILTLKKRDGDFLFRWGGEEFVLIIPEISAEQVYALASRMHEYIENRIFENQQVKISYTASMGIYCGYGEEGSNNIIEIADMNLYKAKNAGRNCVRI